MSCHHQITQSAYCLMCHQPLNRQVSLLHLITPQCLCLNCLQKQTIIDQYYDFHGYNMHILYDYNDFFRSLLFQYKGLYDYELRVVFLWPFKAALRHRYQDYVIVVVPSDDRDNLKRGFMPNAEIVKSLSPDPFLGLYKRYSYKQSSMDFYNRQGIHDVIGIRDDRLLYHKKVLLFDDVTTSGHTLSACMNLIKNADPLMIDILVLATRQRFRDSHRQLSPREAKICQI